MNATEEKILKLLKKNFPKKEIVYSEGEPDDFNEFAVSISPHICLRVLLNESCNYLKMQIHTMLFYNCSLHTQTVFNSKIEQKELYPMVKLLINSTLKQYVK